MGINVNNINYLLSKLVQAGLSANHLLFELREDRYIIKINEFEHTYPADGFFTLEYMFDNFLMQYYIHLGRKECNNG